MSRSTKGLASNNTNTFHDWAKLPTELKRVVLTHYMLDNSVFERMAFKCFLERLIKTGDREFVDSALDICYKHCTFSVGLCGTVITTGKPMVPDSRLASKIRHLKVNAPMCYVYQRVDDMLVSPVTCWQRLLRPTRELDGSGWYAPQSLRRHREEGRSLRRESESEWQTSFTNLKSLEVALIVSDRRKHALTGAGVELDLDDIYSDLTESTEMFLQADEVKVTFPMAPEYTHDNYTEEIKPKLFGFMEFLGAWIEGNTTRKK